MMQAVIEETKESDDLCCLSPYKSKIIHSNLLLRCLLCGHYSPEITVQITL